MHIFIPTVLTLLSFPYLIAACPGHLAARQAASSATSPFLLGDDPPAAPATLGYTINHFALNVNDLNSMVTFYRDVLGLRHIFTYTASLTYTVAYLGYSHGGKNGTGYQTGAELYAEMNNAEGLLELLYHNATNSVNGSSALPFLPSTKIANTFSHIGLVVPDIEAAQRRMESQGVSIVKLTGEPIAWGSEGAKAFGLDEAHWAREAARAALQGITEIGFDSYMLIKDPDGNLVEVQQQVPGGA
ncbi:hypothetical protein LTR15_011479 [Elasticomyces elasticus]|nr:hypothetical protein LTR15_011479 [Elasticomyces elasticus]